MRLLSTATARARRRATALHERSRAAGTAETGTAMLLVIMLMLLVASLGLIVTASVVQQVRPTAYGQKSTSTVFAAEAGLQVALGQIRSTQRAPDATGKVRGEPTQLPCTMSGPVVATAGAADGLRYDVVISYFNVDPVGRPAAWRASNALACSPTDGVATAPFFALIESDGLDEAASSDGNRTLESIYRFDVDNSNIAGGLFFTINSLFCLQADAPVVGAKVRYVVAGSCVSNAPLQSWVYDTDYAIKLGSTITADDRGLCLTGSASSNVEVTLQDCVKGQSTQLFSYEGGAKFRLQNAGNSDYSGHCLWAGQTSVAAGNALRTGPGCGSANDEWGSWAPEFRVGAGAAGKATNQIVNYREFGRCFDVTNEDVNYQYLILYPCKQDPSPGGLKLFWNHKFFYGDDPAPQPIVVRRNNSGTDLYCVTTPAPGVTPAQVRMRPCVAGATDQRFVRSGDTGTYATSFLFVDQHGRCLSVGPKGSGHAQWSTVTASTCTGGAEQKWNAPPDAIDATLSNTRETVRG